MLITVTPIKRVPISGIIRLKQTSALTEKDFTVNVTYSQPGFEKIGQARGVKETVIDQQGDRLEDAYADTPRTVEEIIVKCVGVVERTEAHRYRNDPTTYGPGCLSASLNLLNEGRTFLLGYPLNMSLVNFAHSTLSTHLANWAWASADGAYNVEYRFLFGARQPNSLTLSVWNYDMLLSSRACARACAIVIKRLAKFGLSKDMLRYLAKTIWLSRCHMAWAPGEQTAVKRHRPGSE
jgi:hypothetical protein